MVRKKYMQSQQANKALDNRPCQGLRAGTHDIWGTLFLRRAPQYMKLIIGSELYAWVGHACEGSGFQNTYR